MTDATVATETRDRVTRRLFINSDGTETGRATGQTSGARIIFLDGDAEVHTIEEDFDKNLPGFKSLPADCVTRAAAAFGWMTAVTNTTGSAKLSLSEKIDAAEGRVERLRTAWTAERESGPRTNDYVEAAARIQEQIGKPWDDKQRAVFAASLEAEDGKRKKLESNPAFKAILDAIKLERAQARAKVSAEKAKGSNGQDLADLLNV